MKGSGGIAVTDLHVRYRDVHALAGVSFAASPGTTVGLLGHNGAGKTTLVRALATLVRPTRGRIVIDGIDAVAAPALVRRRIGVTGQYAGLDDYLTARENLELIGRLAGLGRASRLRASELVDRFDLGAIASRRVGQLSGGSRRRVDLAASLVGSPSVLFLDEPTTGLDPLARAALWDVVTELARNGTTVVLTTQYLEEAEQLADHVLVLERGRIAASGTPSELTSLVGGKVVRATIPDPGPGGLPVRVDTAEPTGDGRLRIGLTVADGAAAADLVARLVGRGAVSDLDVSSPGLDDVFVHLATAGAPT